MYNMSIVLNCVVFFIVKNQKGWRLNQNFEFKIYRHEFYIFYIIKQDIRIYMLPIAGQTAGPNGLKFVVDN